MVVVEAQVDADRVREALARGGLLLAPAGDGALASACVSRRRASRTSPPTAALRETLLEGVGVRSALPVELERGRAILEVESELARRGAARGAGQQRRAARAHVSLALRDEPASGCSCASTLASEPAPGSMPRPRD